MTRDEKRTVDRSLPKQGREKGERIDLGLEILSYRASRQARRGYTQYEIAAFCGCTRSAIFQIEKKALRKLWRRISREGRTEELQRAVVALGQREYAIGRIE